MSEISKEALAAACEEKVKQLEFSVKQSAFDSVRQELKTELAIARVALLALRKEREVAAPFCEVKVTHLGPSLWSHSVNFSDARPPAGVHKLYTTPPAQSVAVPDELAARHAYESHVKSQYQYPMLERHPDDAGPWSGEYKEATRRLAWEDWLKSWNACRAAMLAAPGKPVAVPDDVLTRLAWNIAVSFADEETKKDKELFHKLINHAVDDCRSQMFTTQGKPVALPDEMTPEMMRAVQTKSELGAYAAANLTGAYDLFSEFWRVACQAAPAAAPRHDYKAIVERIAEILHGKVTDIDLLTVTVQAMKERNSKPERQRDAQPSQVVPDVETATCKYCGGSGYYRWQQSYNKVPCPCSGCTELAAPGKEPLSLEELAGALRNAPLAPSDRSGRQRDLDSPEPPAPDGNHWYLVSWCSPGGRFGCTEVSFDNPWVLGSMRGVQEIVAEANDLDSRTVVILSVFPIAAAPGKEG